MMSSEKTNNSRRDFLVKSMALIPTVVIGGAGAGAIGVATSATAQAAPASEPASGNTAAASDWKPQFFNDREWVFINAAVARLIPADELGPGAKEAGVPEFIDRQLNTPYATGSIWYMQGPFNPDVPKEMGYQLPLVPKQIYNLGIADAEAWCQDKYHKTFAELSSEQQDEALGLWESGKAEFKQLPASLFFTYLLQNTREGFFSDPIHGGNKGMVGWTLINFPGARADFMDWVERGERYPFPPVSINGGEGVIMATVLKKTDVAIVGFGWVGAIMAKELTEAGLNVVALERGPDARHLAGWRLSAGD
ncbi:gluconate 2-dehydrogenase subunit gamma [Klebsiella variicola]|nr:gluconate 2-dehydrogenase subunit gamma [Klebsiella variicola]